MQVRPLSGDTDNRLAAVDADFRRSMELIHSVRPSPTQFSVAVKNQENLRRQGALGIRFGQTREKTAQHGGPGSGVKRQNEGDGSGNTQKRHKPDDQTQRQ
ncbi:hypothetical protein M5689_000690 [Euphorbia peplus]|nr:hypothetical protein M5689_000690 [Euphorbia peplus]